MKKVGGGSIVNIASIGASRPRPGLVWYNASKGAVANVSIDVICYRSQGLLTLEGFYGTGGRVWA